MPELTQYQKDRQKKPHYEDRNGKIYHLGVSVSDAEAKATIERNAAKKAKNAASVASAKDPQLATMMGRLNEMNDQDIADTEREINAIFSKRAASKAK